MKKKIENDVQIESRREKKDNRERGDERVGGNFLCQTREEGGSFERGNTGGGVVIILPILYTRSGNRFYIFLGGGHHF